MIQFWRKSIRWLASIGIMLWFVALLLLPIYGALQPWPEAQRKLIEEGVSGTPLMIGAGGASFRDSTGFWSKQSQRLFLVIPESLSRLELFTYLERSGSDLSGVERTLIHSRLLIPLVILWIVAGVFTFWTIRNFTIK